MREDLARKYRRRWWHFGTCPDCALRYSEWYYWPGIGEYCFPCAADDLERESRTPEARDDE